MKYVCPECGHSITTTYPNNLCSKCYPKQRVRMINEGSLKLAHKILQVATKEDIK